MRYFTPLFPAGEIFQSHSSSKSVNRSLVKRSSTILGCGYGLEASILDDERIAGRRFLRRVFPIGVAFAIEQQPPARGLFGGRELVIGGESQAMPRNRSGDQSRVNNSHKALIFVHANSLRVRGSIYPCGASSGRSQFAFVLAFPALAQIDGRISGSVVDPTGACGSGRVHRTLSEERQEAAADHQNIRRRAVPLHRRTRRRLRSHRGIHRISSRWICAGSRWMRRAKPPCRRSSCNLPPRRKAWK